MDRGLVNKLDHKWVEYNILGRSVYIGWSLIEHLYLTGDQGLMDLLDEFMFGDYSDVHK